jgi:hypothetical protein
VQGLLIIIIERVHLLEEGRLCAIGAVRIHHQWGIVSARAPGEPRRRPIRRFSSDAPVVRERLIDLGEKLVDAV